MKIEALILDLDDTLLPEDECNKNAYQKGASLVSGSGVDISKVAERAKREVKINWEKSVGFEYAQRIGFGSTDGSSSRFSIHHNGVDVSSLNGLGLEIRRRSWRETLKHFEIADLDLAIDIADYFSTIRQKSFNPYSDVLDALSDLSKNYRLAILTNGLERVQREKIEACGIDRFTDILVVSERVGVGKPHQSMFDAAVNSLGVPKESIAMIGDSLKNDIAGAQDYGLGRTIWVASEKTPDSELIKPDVRIANISELPQVLKLIS